MRYKPAMAQLVLIRHGQSQWNLENRFTGWVDVPLSPQGEKEARTAGALLKAKGLRFDVAHTSLLRRAIHTLNLVLEEMEQLYVPVHKSWRLNERHYGGLQGLNKSETADKHGEEQVKIWRRSYDVRPPLVQEGDAQHPGDDPRYAALAPDMLPGGECLKDTVDRMLPYWYDAIATDLRAGKKVIVAAHGNSLRALVKHLDRVSDDAIVKLNIPTGVPLAYELDNKLVPVRSEYIGDPEAIEKAQQAVAAQGQTKA